MQTRPGMMDKSHMYRTAAAPQGAAQGVHVSSQHLGLMSAKHNKLRLQE